MVFHFGILMFDRFPPISLSTCIPNMTWEEIVFYQNLKKKKKSEIFFSRLPLSLPNCRSLLAPGTKYMFPRIGIEFEEKKNWFQNLFTAFYTFLICLPIGSTVSWLYPPNLFLNQIFPNDYHIFFLFSVIFFSVSAKYLV